MDKKPLNPTTILVVDDESGLVDLIRNYLASEGFIVLVADNGPSALDLMRTHRPDVVVLDLMLPGMDGIEVCRRLRQFSNAYVLMLTAKSDEIDKIVGLAVGADDYVTKPFSPRELVARVKALLRRPRIENERDPIEPPIRHFEDLMIDEARHEVTHSGDIISLTAREFELLAVLAAHPGRVFTRAQMLERVWGDAYYDDHVVDVHVGNLRKKLDDDALHPRYVETVRGVGYRLAARPN